MPFADDNILYRSIDPDVNYFNEIFQSLQVSQQSNYFTVDQLDSTLSSASFFTIFNYNIRSFNCNGDSFVSLLESFTKLPDVVVLTETWLCDNNKDICNMEGYSSYHTIRLGRRSGGVSVFCRSALRSEKVVELSISSETIESSAVELVVDGEIYVILAIYRPHSDSVENFTSVLLGLLNRDSVRNRKVILLGDLNIDLLSLDCNNINSFIHDLQSLHYLPVITRPTRFPSTNVIPCPKPSLLDHIWINTLQSYTSGILSMDLTDHCLTFVAIPCKVDTNSKVRIAFRSHKPEYLRNFTQQLSDVCWDEVLIGDINDKVQQFSDHVNQLYCSCFPLLVKYVSQKRLKKPWLSPGIIKSIKTKSLYFKYTKLGLLCPEFNRKYRNLLTNVIRSARRDYYLKAFNSSKNNMKKTWRVIKTLLLQNSSQVSIKSVLVGDNEVSGANEIADAFNNFFSNVAADLDNAIPESNLSPLESVTNNIQNSIFLTPVSDYECSSIISKVKLTSYGPNVIPARLFLLMKSKLCGPISNLINETFSKGIFPNSLKRAQITPIFKHGDRKLVSNYRPISVLPFISKYSKKLLLSDWFLLCLNIK